VKPSITFILVTPITRTKPRLRSVKAPLRAALTDSTTCLRPIEMRHAVVPKVIRCHHAISAAGAVSIPLQHRSQPLSTGTKGTVLVVAWSLGAGQTA